jgi:hypothetical protein
VSASGRVTVTARSRTRRCRQLEDASLPSPIQDASPPAAPRPVIAAISSSVDAAIGCSLQDASPPPPPFQDASPPPPAPSVTTAEDFFCRFGERFHGAGGDFYFPGGLEEIGVDWTDKFLTPVLTERINGAGLEIIPVGMNHVVRPGLSKEPRGGA